MMMAFHDTMEEFIYILSVIYQNEQEWQFPRETEN